MVDGGGGGDGGGGDGDGGGFGCFVPKSFRPERQCLHFGGGRSGRKSFDHHGCWRILGASRDGEPDWGLPRVKYAIGECNPTLCTPKAGLVISWSDRRERSEENPGASKKENLLILIRCYC